MAKTDLIDAIKANLEGIGEDLNNLAVKVAAGNYAQTDFSPRYRDESPS